MSHRTVAAISATALSASLEAVAGAIDLDPKATAISLTGLEQAK